MTSPACQIFPFGSCVHHTRRWVWWVILLFDGIITANTPSFHSRSHIEFLLWKGGQLGGKDVAVWVGVLLWASWGEQSLILRWEKQQLLSFQVQAGRADEWPAVPQGTWAGSHRASHRWCWRGDAGGSTAAWQQGEVLWCRRFLGLRWLWRWSTSAEQVARICSGQGGDGTQWECPVETTRKRGRRSSAWGSEELLVCQLENTGWCWDKERRGRRREASPSAAGKESYRIPRKVPANDTRQTFSKEYIPVTPSLSCTSCMNTFFVTRFVLIFQCRTERRRMLKSLQECSYTSETAKGRTAQLYLNYCAPTCPTIQGGKNGGTVQELKCK